MPAEVLIQISAPHFTAGIVIVERSVTDAAPILRYMVGWESRRVTDYCDRKAWRLDWRRTDGVWCRWERVKTW